MQVRLCHTNRIASLLVVPPRLLGVCDDSVVCSVMCVVVKCSVCSGCVVVVCVCVACHYHYTTLISTTISTSATALHIIINKLG